MKKLLMMIPAIAAGTILSAQSIYPGQFEEKIAIENKVKTPAECFELSDVRLEKSRFSETMTRDSIWLVSVSADRLLHSFRTSAGVWAGNEGGYMTVKKLGGWESLDCELRGHTTGHVLSATALMYASTGSEAMKAKGDSLVTGLAQVQKTYGNGYISAYPENLIDRNIAGQRVWAPWYTLHKIISGLIDQYMYADNEQALEIADNMASWAYEKLKGLDEATRSRMLRNEFGGIPDSFWNLYAITENPEHKWLAEYFHHNEVIDPLRAQNADFGTKHTNTFIPKVIAEARHYELTGFGQSGRAAAYFFDEMINNHCYAPGCLSDKEHFFDPDHFSKHITGYTGETCCTYNMLKLARHLFCWEPSAKVADYYERALYNHILGQQDPESGMISYFLPLMSGSHKVYSTPFNSFWCCVGSSFESNAKFGESIYYKSNDGLYVNLMIPSTLNWKEKGIVLTQQTDFPDDETTCLSLKVEKPVKTTIRFRYPSWSGKPEVKVNGRRQKVGNSEWIEITRTWKDGDRIEVRYPMSLRLEKAPDNEKVAALAYGPIVLAAPLGTDGFRGSQPVSDPGKYNDYYTYDYNVPADIATSIDFDLSKIRKSEGRLEFVTENGIVLKPLYDIHKERYTVYWNEK